MEKDYWATQLLNIISQLTAEGYKLVFSGGTCLAKAHQNTFRMSEDIDIKMVPTQNTLALSKNQQKSLRKFIHQLIIHAILQSDEFNLVPEPKIESEYRYQKILIEYPKSFDHSDTLRPHLQLDLTESTLLEPAKIFALSSLYANILKEPPEVQAIACVSVGSTACEKLISLLRRTAAFARNNSNHADDKTLIRHVYDLHLIFESLDSPQSLKAMVQQVIETDQKKFSNKHSEFRDDPSSELQYGLSILINQPHHNERYNQFIGPLVYHQSPASWDEAIASVTTLTELWI